MRIAVIAVIASFLCGWSLQASAYTEAVASPDTTSSAAKGSAATSPATDSAPAPAQHATEAAAATKSAASDEATEKSDEANAAQTAEEKAQQEKADLVLFKRLGYYQRTVKGKTRFCKTEHVSGSRLESTTTCSSAEQIKAELQAQK